MNIRSSDFGCGGAIHYPISARAERWLVSRLPADLSTQRGQLLTRAVSDFNFDGEAIDAARARYDLYESKIPLERKWGNFFSKKTRITSSQILQMAFGVGNLQSAHARLVAYFVGFVNDDFTAACDPTNSPQSDDDGSIIGLKNFFAVAALAGTSSASVFVDA